MCCDLLCTTLHHRKGDSALVSVFIADYCNKLGSKFDDITHDHSVARAKFIQHFLPLTSDDQLVDIGGGTGKIAQFINADVKMTKPVVCVDSSSAMIQIAKQTGAITIQSSAENFLASRPKYPLRRVLFSGSFHLLDDQDAVLTALAKYMPDDGMCLIMRYKDGLIFPFLKAVKETFPHSLEEICRMAEAKGLKAEVVTGSEPFETTKALVLDFIKHRILSAMLKWSDSQLEQTMADFETDYKDQDLFKFDLEMEGVLISKQ